MHHKTDAFDKFEEISALVKRSHLSFSDPKRDYEVNDSKSRRNEADVAREAWITKSRNLLSEVSLLLYFTVVFRSRTVSLSTKRDTSSACPTSPTRLKCWSGLAFLSERKTAISFKSQ